MNTKAFFVQKEGQWAGDYQLYAPSVASPANKEVMKGNTTSAKKEIEVKINERGSKKEVSIYQRPVEKAKIVLKFHEKGKIIYKNKWKKGKKEKDLVENQRKLCYNSPARDSSFVPSCL